MKKVITMTVIIGILIGAGIIMVSIKSRFTVDFATDIYIKYKYENQNINEKINDDTDFVTLKSILNGVVYSDNPSCGFSVDISITFSSDDKNVILCMALDGCPIIRIDETNKYFKIPDEDREMLDIILKKYEFIFPSI